MNPRRRQRLLRVLLILAGIGIAAAFVFNAFRENMVFFFPPSEVLSGAAPQGRNFRLGGLVEAGSVTRESDGLTVRFRVTDLKASLPVVYKGILPDLFREGQGIVALGRVRPDGVFEAEEVLAKHDENYMPPEVAASLPTTAMTGPQSAAGGKPGGVSR
jgi:cytochrome c-type biogenesis protein CcmE